MSSSAATKLDLPSPLLRKAATGLSPSVLSEIYQDDVNIAIWKNTLINSLIDDVQQLIEEAPALKAVLISTPETVADNLKEHHSAFENKTELCEYIALLVDMFSTLFEQERVGVRLSVLEHAMCPKFHVDNVPCRLVTTFVGPATEWLMNIGVDRSKLGAGSLGLSDDKSGIYQDDANINQLVSGDVALLKGEGWFNNELGGLVHRSPSLNAGEKRLVLTLDFSN